MRYTERELKELGKARQGARLAMLKEERASQRKAFNKKDQERKKEIDLLTRIYKEGE